MFGGLPALLPPPPACRSASRRCRSQRLSRDGGRERRPATGRRRGRKGEGGDGAWGRRSAASPAGLRQSVSQSVSQSATGEALPVSFCGALGPVPPQTLARSLTALAPNTPKMCKHFKMCRHDPE